MEQIKLKHAKNFRDLGGFKTVDGRTVKSHMLIRGTTLFKLSQKDIQKLRDEYNLSTIIDLRTKKETLEKPDDVVDGVSYYHMPILTEAVVGLSHEKKVRSFKSLETMTRMEDLYIRMVTDESLDNLVETMRKILTMPEENYSLVFHCTAGKDRTGIMAALILAFLGVDRETIIRDYVYSNRFTIKKARFVYFALLIVKLSHGLAKKVKHSLMAKKSFIEASLSRIEQDYGSLDNFFVERFHFTPEETKAIKDRFLC